MKIGLFGGSFNPIHNNHLDIIKYLINKKIVDEVWIIPCKKHAFNKALINPKDRVNMINLAIKKLKNVKVCDIELKSRGKNYTIKTIRKLKSKYPYNFYLISGSDFFWEIDRWYKVEDLIKEINFIIFKRVNYPIKKIKGLTVYKIVNLAGRNISSTEIRKKIKQEKSIKRLVPIKVEEYIKKNKLYK
jgi:nicotinate-nucleotide adenylyltransferase